MNWYYEENGQQQGPISQEQLDELIKTGTVLATTLVWREGMSEWQPLSQQQSELSSSVSEDLIQTCAMCNQMLPASEMLKIGNSCICANCKPEYEQRLRENPDRALSMGETRYAGFWVRVGAMLLDSLILSPISIATYVGSQAYFLTLTHGTPPDQGPELFAYLAKVMSVSIALQFITWVLIGIYFVLMTGKYGATLGKKICGIKVTMEDRASISYKRAFGRYFAKVLNDLTFYIGYMLVGWTEEKTGLHDMICKTRVVYK